MSALMTVGKIWGVSILTLTGFVRHREVENHSSRAFCEQAQVVMAAVRQDGHALPHA